MRNLRLIYILLSLPLTILAADLQAQDTSRSRYVFRSWNNSSGLPQNTVKDIELDNRGFLWAATEEGLACFDGSEFTIVDQNSLPGLYSNNFYSLRNDGDTLWAASRNTVLSLVRGRIATYDCREGLGAGSILCVERWKGITWAGCSNGNLLTISNGKVQRQKVQKVNGAIETLYATSQGMYMGTSRGLFLLHPNGEVSEIAEMRDKDVMSLCLTDTQLFVGTSEEGIYVRTDNSWTHIGREQGLKDLFINCFYAHKDGRIYLGTRTGGYQYIYDGKVITPDQGEYSHDGIRAILAYSQDLLWLGTTASGLVQMKPARVNMRFEKFGLGTTIVLPLYEHKDGSIFVGTARNGLTVIKGDASQTFTTENGLSSNLVVSIYGNEKYTYIGTAAGLDRYNMSTRKLDKHYSRKEGLTTVLVNAVFCDSRNKTWVSTRNGGLHLVDDEGVHPLPIAGLGDDATVICMTEDREGRLYMGTMGKGYFMRDNSGRVTNYQTSNGFPADIVYDAEQDNQGVMWFATDKGVVKYNGKQYLLFDKSTGLRSSECYAVMHDGEGYIWTSGNFGIQRIPVQELTEEVAKERRPSAISAVMINSSDGMNNSEANGGIFPSAWKLDNGHLIFPTVSGVVDINPETLTVNAQPLNLQLVSMRYADTTITDLEGAHIPQGLSNLEFRYTSIDFSKAEDIRYFYRLRGLSDQWVSAGNRRVAYFSGLTPGTYHFEVRAEQYGKISPVLSRTIQVDPHFYQTLWFKALLVLLTLGIVFIAIIAQKQKASRKVEEQKAITRAQLTGQEKERQVIGTELHDSINQQLATAKLYLDFARSNEDMRLPMVEKGEVVIQNVINEIRALCKSMIPPTLKDIGLVDALTELMTSYHQVAGFKIHFKNEAALNGLNEDLKFSLFRIVQELLNNIVKHAQASEVWVEFTMVDKRLQLLIRDNGKGAANNGAKAGLGLSNIRHRLELFDGTMEVRSTPGQGFQMLIQVPCD